VKHLGAAARNLRTEADCKVPRGADKSWPSLTKDGMYRVPGATVAFGDVTLNSYMNPGDRPLAPTRGHLADHIGLSVTDLNAWMAKLKGEGVKFLGKPYKVGDARAVMIEGPSKEAIELIEIK
jgi:glyoxalase/bleomycin resistance protein/dioxygenase superfamily protein